MPSLIFRSVFLGLLAGFGGISHLSAADLFTWPGQFTPLPWEPATITDSDVVGPDGIVYPDFTGAGVTGGVPDINAPQIRSTYTLFDVLTYGAKGDGVTLDDAAVAAAAAAAAAALNNLAGSGKAILYFPAGSYLLSAPIDLGKSNVVVDGDGPAATLIKLTAGEAKNWPLILQSVTRFEVRDSQFLGTWAEINNRSNAYLGWIDATDSLMDNVQARDLRHMAIFQLANRCIIRSSTFTGEGAQAWGHAQSDVSAFVLTKRKGLTVSLRVSPGSAHHIADWAAPAQAAVASVQ